MLLPSARVTRTAAFTIAAAILLIRPDVAAAQNHSIGAGPRMSFVRGDASAPESSSRYSGGQLRAMLSQKSAIELSIDYRSHLNESLTERIRDYPFQGSLLLYPVRSAISAYVLGGVGWYSQRIDTVANDQVIETKTTRTMGYHGGLGGEIRLGRRASVHLDYRYTMIRFGDSTNSGQSGAVPIPGLSGLQERLKLSHQGSMWTSGLTVFF